MEMIRPIIILSINRGNHKQRIRQLYQEINKLKELPSLYAQMKFKMVIMKTIEYLKKNTFNENVIVANKNGEFIRIGCSKEHDLFKFTDQAIIDNEFNNFKPRQIDTIEEEEEEEKEE